MTAERDNSEIRLPGEQDGFQSEGAQEYCRKAMGMFVKEDYAGMLELMDMAIKEYPRDPECYYLRAEAKKKLKSFVQSVKDFDKAIELRPDCAKSKGERTMVMIALREFSLDVKHWDKEIKESPDNANAHYQRALAKGKLDRFDEAVDDAKRSIELAKGTGDARLAEKAQEALKRLQAHKQ